MKQTLCAIATAVVLGLPGAAAADVVHADDVIITGSECLGYDCATDGTESFGFDTLRLKENNTRIAFDDTSATAGFPANDWAIRANDTASGGQSYLAVDDVTAGRTPFLIQPGAPTSTLTLRADGRVGVGTWAPAAALDVQRADGTAQLRVAETSSTVASRTLLALVNNGSPGVSLQDAASGDLWKLGLVRTGTTAGHFAITRQDGDGAEVVFFKTGAIRMGTGSRHNLILTPQGNLTIKGVLSQGSDAAAKENVAPADASAVLERIATLPLSTWSYRGDDPAVRHLGPMAQDFRGAFGLGESETAIAAIDADGVALAGIQALLRELRQRDAAIAEMRSRLAALEAQVQALAAAQARGPRTAALAQ